MTVHTGPAPRVPSVIVAADLDGTLVTADRSVSERTSAAIANVRAVGGIFLAVTDRPLRDALPTVSELGANGLVCSGGAVVYDPAIGRVVRSTTFAPADAVRLVVTLRTTFLSARVGIDYLDRCELDAGFRLRRYGSADLVAPDRIAVASEPVVKVIVQSDTLEVEQLARRANRLLAAAHPPVTVTVPGPAHVEILPGGVDKATHLAELVGRMTPRPPTVAFGDSLADLPMLRWAMMPVAVANAHPGVLAAAREVTAATDADGVAVYLEHMLAAWARRSAS